MRDAPSKDAYQTTTIGKQGNHARRRMTRPRESAKAPTPDEEGKLEQIEYLLYQSTQGIHFMFDHAEAAKVLREATDDSEFYSFSNSERVQEMLSTFIERPTLEEKRLYLETLKEPEYKLLVRAYFHLVENTILANTSIRH
jgi:hypothetical protein